MDRPKERDLAGVVEALRADMRRLLDVLADREAGPAAIAEAWRRCEEGTERFGELRAAVGELPAGEREAVEGVLEDVLRLNAVALGLVEGERVELLDRLRRARASRHALQASAAPTPGPTGASCNVTG